MHKFPTICILTLLMAACSVNEDKKNTFLTTAPPPAKYASYIDALDPDSWNGIVLRNEDNKVFVFRLPMRP